MKHFLYCLFISISVCLRSVADIEHFIKTQNLSDLTLDEINVIEQFENPGIDAFSSMEIEEIKHCERLCYANIILTIFTGNFEEAYTKLTHFTLILKIISKDFQPVCNWEYLNNVLRGIRETSKNSTEIHSSEGILNFPRISLTEIQHLEEISPETPIITGLKATDAQPASTNSEKRSSKRPRVSLQIPTDMDTEEYCVSLPISPDFQIEPMLSEEPTAPPSSVK